MIKNIITINFLWILNCYAEENGFRQLACKLFSYQVEIAESHLERNEIKNLLSPDIRPDYFKLKESEKIKFLLFWMAKNKPEEIDGEKALLLTVLFGGQTSKWKFDKKTAANRYQKVMQIKKSRRAAFVESLNLSTAGMEKTLSRVPFLLELK